MVVVELSKKRLIYRSSNITTILRVCTAVTTTW